MLLKILKKVFGLFLPYFVGGVVLVLLVLLLPIFLPPFLLKPFVVKCKTFLRPDLLGPVSGVGKTLAQFDDDNVHKTVIVVKVLFKGWVNCNDLIKKVEDKIFPKYPELKQYWVDWFGYKFWKLEQNFQTRNHVNLLSDSVFADFCGSSKDLTDTILSSSFQSGLSPWEIIIVLNKFEEQTTAIYFRAHHALMDGHSLLSLCEQLFGNSENQQILTSTTVSRNVLTKILTTPIKLLSVLGHIAINSVTPLMWRLPKKSKSKTWCTTENSPTFQKASIFAIQQKFDVSVEAVIQSLLIGGIKRFGASEIKRASWSKVYFMSAIPYTNREDKLDNLFSFSLSSYSLEENDTIKRLMMIHQNFEGLKNSFLPEIGFLLMNLLGSHWNFMGKYLNTYKYASLVTVYFPLRKMDWKIGDCSMEEFSFYVRVGQGDMSGFFAIYDMQENIRVTPIFNSALLESNAIQALCACMQEEFEILKECL